MWARPIKTRKLDKTRFSARKALAWMRMSAKSCIAIMASHCAVRNKF